jgi:hypothetical protein
MALPTFVGIGEEKCGTTWLRNVLASHRDIFLPTLATEVHFFDRYYGRGVQWYERFFRNSGKAHRYGAIGEVTPSYFHSPQAPARMAAMPSVRKLILLLRNPVDRVYSDYWHRVRIDRFEGTVEDFVTAYPDAVERGFYSLHAARYLTHFCRDQLLVLTLEEVSGNVLATRNAIAEFLGVSTYGFDISDAARKHNGARLPRFPALYTRAVYAARKLRDMDLDWVVWLAKTWRVPRLFEKPAGVALPPMASAMRQRLWHLYIDDVRQTERVLGLNLEHWCTDNDPAGVGR